MNKRSRVRFRTDLTVKITCLNSPGPSTKGRLANLSAHGLSVIVDREFPEGAAVKVEWGDTSFMGELVYCHPQGKEFVAGLKVEDPVYDSTVAPQAEKRLS